MKTNKMFFFDLLRIRDRIYDGNVIGSLYADVSVINAYIDKNGFILNFNIRMGKNVDDDTLKLILANLEVKYHCKAFRDLCVNPDSYEIIVMKNIFITKQMKTETKIILWIFMKCSKYSVFYF